MKTHTDDVKAHTSVHNGRSVLPVVFGVLPPAFYSLRCYSLPFILMRIFVVVIQFQMQGEFDPSSFLRCLDIFIWYRFWVSPPFLLWNFYPWFPFYHPNCHYVFFADEPSGSSPNCTCLVYFTRRYTAC